jgi:hypothetical protein
VEDFIFLLTRKDGSYSIFENGELLQRVKLYDSSIDSIQDGIDYLLSTTENLSVYVILDLEKNSAVVGNTQNRVDLQIESIFAPLEKKVNAEFESIGSNSIEMDESIKTMKSWLDHKPYSTKTHIKSFFFNGIIEFLKEG